MGSRDIINYVVVCGGICRLLLLYWSVYSTSNNHSQQGHAKFVLQSEGV